MIQPSPTQSLLSARSRRLRTIGILLLAAIIGMTIYGATRLMPATRLAIARNHAVIVRATSKSVAQTALTSAEAAHQKHVLKALELQVAVDYAYWGICLLLAVSLVFVAWLDFREVSKNYMNQRLRLWTETTVPAKHDDPARN